MAKYEAHVTFPRATAPQLTEALAAYGTDDVMAGFRYSAFDADPVMGDKPFAYLTAYDTDPHRLYARCLGVIGFLAGKYVVGHLRVKVERIVYDTKTGVNELTEETDGRPARMGA